MNQKLTSQLHHLLNSAHHSYEKQLNSYAFFKVHNLPLSQDLVQDTFIKTWEYLRKGGKIHLMRAFLYHILNDLIVDEYRKSKTTSLDALLEKGYEPSFDHSEQNRNFFDGKAAMILIKQLPVVYQDIMRMRYTQDLSLKEISLITGKSKNNVAVNAHRGLEKLRFLYNNPSSTLSLSLSLFA